MENLEQQPITNDTIVLNNCLKTAFFSFFSNSAVFVTIKIVTIKILDTISDSVNR